MVRWKDEMKTESLERLLYVMASGASKAWICGCIRAFEANPRRLLILVACQEVAYDDFGEEIICN
jgi:hypothetical protein